MKNYRKLIMAAGFTATAVFAPGLTSAERVQLLELIIMLSIAGNVSEHVMEAIKDGIRSRASGGGARISSVRAVSAGQTGTGTGAH